MSGDAVRIPFLNTSAQTQSIGHPGSDALNLGWMNMQRLQPFLKELASKGRGHVIALGGSEASGVGCEDGAWRLHDCAWPARLSRWN